MRPTIFPSTTYFDEMTEDARWLGWGYLGERNRAKDDDYETVVEVDAAVMAATEGWTDEERFHWANSKMGRWAAEDLFAGVPAEKVAQRGLFAKVGS